MPSIKVQLLVILFQFDSIFLFELSGDIMVTLSFWLYKLIAAITKTFPYFAGIF